MRFWDSSALSPLVLPEANSREMFHHYRADRAVIVWWGTSIECVSAIRRREREGLAESEVDGARRALVELAALWTEVPPAEAIRSEAMRLLGAHLLRAADALQLAAAVVAGGSEISRFPFVTLDRRLGVAAAAEGFRVAGV